MDGQRESLTVVRSDGKTLKRKEKEEMEQGDEQWKKRERVLDD